MKSAFFYDQYIYNTQVVDILVIFSSRYRMTKRAASDILNDLNPIKSAKRYDDTWSHFIAYVESSERPSE